MCGRYTLRRLERLTLYMNDLPFPPIEEFSEHRFNIAPSQRVPIVRINRDGVPTVRPARWGLIPSWSSPKAKAQPINARAESLTRSGMFRQAFTRRRCLMPADGFYEWQGAKPPKVPWFIRRPEDEPFTFAGIWERYAPSPDAEPLDTCCLITTQPNDVMKPIHNRMPVILHRRDHALWLDRTRTAAEVEHLLKPYDGPLEAWPVSCKVNTPKTDSPDLIDKADG